MVAVTRTLPWVLKVLVATSPIAIDAILLQAVTT